MTLVKCPHCPGTSPIPESLGPTSLVICDQCHRETPLSRWIVLGPGVSRESAEEKARPEPVLVIDAGPFSKADYEFVIRAQARLIEQQQRQIDELNVRLAEKAEGD